MSAEMLRRAAALMRERATAATTGVWTVNVDHHRDFDVPDVSVWSDDAMSYVTEDVVTSDNSHFLSNAEHIASWHPAVALAVADWLDLEAEAPTECPNCTVSHRPDFHHWRAYAVARAYLGEQS